MADEKSNSAEELFGFLNAIPHCVECDFFCYPWQKFCIQCGTENPGFDLDELMYEMEVHSLEEAKQKMCSKDHIYMDPAFGEFPFCEFCGANFITLALDTFV